jgi:hypothetical protein
VKRRRFAQNNTEREVCGLARMLVSGKGKPFKLN